MLNCVQVGTVELEHLGAVCLCSRDEVDSRYKFHHHVWVWLKLRSYYEIWANYFSVDEGKLFDWCYVEILKRLC